jgi:ubiquinone/menaquinone biosynthesis C-methylase UbiE
LIAIESNQPIKPQSVNLAFSKQSVLYDQLDKDNIILQDLRAQVYEHVQKFLKPGGKILELNAGTGIDALHFALQGHFVHATDLSDGMISQINKKIEGHQLQRKFSSQRLSYENLELLTENNFDFVFSNFGGLNCVDDLTRVTRSLPPVLKKDAIITWVIMPKVCPTEWLCAISGNFKFAFRRSIKNGVIAHLEGQYFKTYYHSLSKIKKAFGPRFELVQTESLALLSPQPHSGLFAKRFPRTYRFSRTVDNLLRRAYPFNRWGDHIIVTFRFKG